MTDPFDPLKILGILGLLIALAFLVETLTEFVFGTIFDRVPVLTPHKWALQYIAIVIGIIGAFHYQIDLLNILSYALQTAPSIPISWYGLAITGAAIGKGSNYLHQFIGKYFPPKKL